MARPAPDNRLGAGAFASGTGAVGLVDVVLNPVIDRFSGVLELDGENDN